jgi:hypothetical protein
MPMKTILLILSFLFVMFRPLFSDEGMWLPLLLEKYNIEDMQQKGFRLTAEDVYSINQTSIKDAIVRIGGCTGVMVSEEGLLLTNHHCGYRDIQSHSTLENDYLTHGFWAMDRSQELPGNMTATFLVRMEDVTSKVLSELNDQMPERERQVKVLSVSRKLEAEAAEGTRYRASVAPFFYGNQYFLFVYDVYEDVRLVGAPPSAIGKFGGDTDNWMWPRHTGDFAYFRVYATENNEPAKYSPDNVPFRPISFLPVSMEGVEEGDFTMVFGYPGTTQQYLTSQAVQLITEVSNPHKIRLREVRLSVMSDEMNQDPAVRIQYSSKYAGVANAWKRWIGESKGLKRLNAVDEKRKQEAEFQSWANEDNQTERNELYGSLMEEFALQYKKLEEYILPSDYSREAIRAIEVISFASRFRNLVAMMERGEEQEEIEMEIRRLKAHAASFYKDYHVPIDRKIFVGMISEYRQHVDLKYHLPAFQLIDDQYNGDIGRYADRVFQRTIFADQGKLFTFLDQPTRRSLKQIRKDPVFELAEQAQAIMDQLTLQTSVIEFTINGLYRRYLAGLMDMQSDRMFYPDANRTMRVAYGHVEGYTPLDAVYYKHYTTLSGIMEKDNQDVYDYKVPEKLKILYDQKDYGSYGRDGVMPVAFVATNHTSGGNSGSPVLNADGHLLGLNFDRAWEGTMSDIMFDPDRCRNISVDIRYVLFITDKYAGAGHLIDEMRVLSINGQGAVSTSPIVIE